MTCKKQSDSTIWLLPSSCSTSLLLIRESPLLFLRSLLLSSCKLSVLLTQSLLTHKHAAFSGFISNIECILSLWYSRVVYKKLFFSFLVSLTAGTDAHTGAPVWRLRAKIQVINSCSWKFVPPNPAGCLSSAHLEPRET